MHKQFLLAALEQAWFGRGVCAPNPGVGAVAVQDEKIIAQAWHQGAGTPHAEQLILAKLPKNLSDITLYVTLEPCNHWGKTPPCVDAIINHGIKQVVYAYRDPNPVVAANNTPVLLSTHNIDVVHYPLAEIDAFYESYCYWTLTKKPFVTVKMAQSFDGKIAGVAGERVMLSNALCHDFTHQERLHTDVILTTARTINQDDPLLNARFPGSEISKPVAIIDSHGALNPRAKVLNTAKHCHIYYNEQFPPEIKHAHCSYHPMPADKGLLDLEAIISHLGGLGYHDVWVEAGGRLFSALHRARLVQRTHVYLVPALLGQNATSLYQDMDTYTQAYTITWQPMGNNMIASLDWHEDRQESTCSPV